MRILKAGFIVVTISLLLLSVNITTVKAADLYSNFQELSAAKVEGTDYKISSRENSSNLAIIAIHGGEIEPGTTELADNIAGSSYSYYSFQGIMSSNNSSLHITSTKFDEPIAISLVQSKSRTLSIHGFSGSSKLTYVGGLDKTMIANITISLQNAGFAVATAPSNLGGTSTSNIVNKNSSNAGVQIELSTAQRASFFSSLTSSGRNTKTAEFYKYTKAIIEGLNPTTVVQPKQVENTTTTPTVQPKPVENTTISATEIASGQNAVQPDVGVSYQRHIQDIGWQTLVANDQVAGTTGQSKRMEALKINLTNAPVGASIKYEAHVQDIGWQSLVSDGQTSGTVGLSKRMEAIKITLVNMPGYSVQYQVHVANIGWQSIVSDGQLAGTTGKSLRIEAIRIKLVKISD